MVRVHFGPPLQKEEKGTPARPSEAGLMGRGETKPQGVFNAGIKYAKCGFDFNEYGGLAQLGERLPCKQEVSGSIPLISTTSYKRLTEVPSKEETSLSFLKELRMYLEN